MKKRLRQTGFFTKLSRYKITPPVYWILYKLYSNEEVTEKQLGYLHSKLYDATTKKISAAGIKVVESVDELFKPIKTIQVNELMGDNYLQRIEQYVKLFPNIKLPNQKYARASVKNLEPKFKWFFETYDYTWDQIISATKIYIAEYHAKNYEYMRTSMFFICKQDATKAINSDLADYCDRFVNGNDFKRDIVFKTDVI